MHVTQEAGWPASNQIASACIEPPCEGK